MGKRQFCRICRTEKNLKYTSKELRQLNKKQLMLAYATQHGEANRASKKLLLTTPTLGNICQVCDERIQIFHRLDDGCHESCSDVEIEGFENTNDKMPVGLIDSIPKGDFTQITQRPETPVIVDDDDMLFNIFMQKFDQKIQLQRNQLGSSLPQNQNPSEGQFVNQFHTTYTPPQSTAGGSEGDETKVIEVLTSRESTPAPITTPVTHTLSLQPPPVPSSQTISNSNLVDAQGHRIVAIIELDDVDENESRNNNEDINHNGLLTPATSSSNELSFTESIEHRSGLLSPIKNGTSDGCNTTATGDDDEEIVFRKVDTIQGKTTPIKKRKRKSYDEKELRLVASLNLVSSDSETEDNSPLKVQVQKSFSTANSKAVTETVPVISKNVVTCKVCKIKLPDSESLSVHDLIHQGVKCVLCQVGFQQVKRLIYHMRRKHREYNGVALSEKPRSGQDSCMTIRLRYMQRTTFYECQLCGRIDEIFREHKDHIIEKHANESKTLKDPIMKQLKCPICKVKCGAQYLSLCRHLISTHDYQQYKSHLRELVHVSAFGWNAARQQEVAKTANIFQFVKRKTFFFECKICRKVVAGYLHHLRHVNKHQTICIEKTNLKSTTSNEIPLSQNSSTETIPKSKNLNLNDVLIKKHKKYISENLKNIDNNLKKVIKSKVNKKSMQIEQVKVKQKANKILKPKVNDVQKAKLNVKQRGKLKDSPKNEEKLKKTVKKIDVKETKNKTQIKIKLKPKEKLLKKLTNGDKITKGKPKKDNTIKNKDKDNKKSKQKVKQNIEQKPQVKKVKIKPSIRQIELQKFKCKYCLKKIKGFHLYNLHLLEQHKENEYTRCNKCNKIFSNSSSNLQEHIKNCPHSKHVSTKLKRKFSQQTLNLEDSSQLCIKKVPENNDSFVNIKYNNYNWLEDLLKLSGSSRESLNSDNSNKLYSPSTALIVPKQSNLQCCYCLHLFANDEYLEEHTKQHHSQKEVLIKYKPLKTVCK
ncbi:uncharacterized protein ACRADG_009152 [Cochliomyia hominivorax]